MNLKLCLYINSYGLEIVYLFQSYVAAMRWPLITNTFQIK